MAGKRNKNIWIMTTEKPQKFVTDIESQPANKAVSNAPSEGVLLKKHRIIKPSKTR